MKNVVIEKHKNRSKVVFSVISFLSAVSVTLAAATVDMRGEVEYTAKGPTGSWSGTNKSVSGKVTLDPLSGAVCVDMKGWDSANTRRDNHAEDMFEADKFPKSCYQITGSSGNTIKGELELHGVKKSLPVSGNLKLTSSSIVFEGEMTVVIEDYGMTRPSLMGMKVNNDVKVKVRISGGL